MNLETLNINDFHKSDSEEQKFAKLKNVQFIERNFWATIPRVNPEKIIYL